MISIRPATPNDVESITILLGDLGYPTNSNDVKVRMREIDQHPDYKTLLAIDDSSNEVAGMIGMSKNLFYEHNGIYIRVLVMVTRKTYRQRGIGKILMLAAEQWAQEINAHTIVISSGKRPERNDAYIFYQKMGYEIKSSGFIKTLEY